MRAVIDLMSSGEVAALLVYRANPAFSLPASWGFENAVEKVPAVISFSSAPDETTRLAGLIMPTNTFLESWGEYSPQKSVTGLLQPAMGPLFDTRPLGDILLSSGAGMGKGGAFQEKDFYEVLRKGWDLRRARLGNGTSPDAFWEENMQRGGAWPGEKEAGLREGGARNAEGRRGQRAAGARTTATSFAFSAQPAGNVQEKSDTFDLVVYPTIQFFDGRTASRLFLQEMPDPVTMVTWDGWVEINPGTARKMDVKKGDLVAIRAGDRVIEMPAFPYEGIPAGTLAVPIGQGHGRVFSRYLSGETDNPAKLLSGRLDPSGGLIFSAAGVTIARQVGSSPLQIPTAAATSMTEGSP